MLSKDENPGPLPQGSHSWLVKWRGTLLETDLPKFMQKDRPRDETTTSFTFKAGDTEPLGEDEPGIETLWEEEMYREREAKSRRIGQTFFITDIHPASSAAPSRRVPYCPEDDSSLILSL